MTRIHKIKDVDEWGRVFAGYLIKTGTDEYLWLGHPCKWGKYRTAARVDYQSAVDLVTSYGGAVVSLWVKRPESGVPRLSKFKGTDLYGRFADLSVVNDVSLRMRWIPAGRFMMGSPEGGLWRWEDEGPQHEVTLTRGFWLGETQVTQLQWHAVMESSPRAFIGNTRPAEQVSWYDCQEFCRRLNERMPELGARLPTEAEWEYACRAGTTSAFNDGSECTVLRGPDSALDKLGWYWANSGGAMHPVRQMSPNAWGLYDMHGNVWEWCADGLREYDGAAMDPLGSGGPRRAIRGGGWRDPSENCRSTSRAGCSEWNLRDDVGLRLAAGYLSW